MSEPELGAPDYCVDSFAIVEPLAVWWEFLPKAQRQTLDPTGILVAMFFHNRRQLLERASRAETRLLTNLPEAALEEMFQSGKLAFIISDMDRRLGRMVDRGEASSDEARSLAEAVKRTREYAVRAGYEPEMIGTLFGLERFERAEQRAAADRPHE